ncbi:hypothetical protein K8O67_02375 [Leptospira borgpetersenii]|nr:hypothetical protein [Leptospira borgpetersenii]UOY18878.1 hypothetical protein K8O67_02375 [Leptospira borgpetersenii]UOZ25511.1 hypothetical protein K8O64_02400 [Leptospira borgpetersenii]UPO15484.1 hypothetical protein MY480_02375 [Leptospira borgpetersenii]UYM85148.1 hypothetical protein MY148_02375 [Leptospira borgpetersenii]UZN11135.1 hypothetical protein M5D49_02370 [Leptospira borgpetersenii]
MLHKKMNKSINILKKLQWGNFIIILLLGFWGIMSDEPYFRAVGHDLNSFDVVNWFVILITGPASLIAYTLSYGVVYIVFGRHSTESIDFAFICYYTIWSILSIFHWKCILWILKQSHLHKFIRKLFFYISVICIILSIWRIFFIWPEVYSGEHRESFLFYLPIQIFALATSFLLINLLIINGTLGIQKKNSITN